MIKHVRCWLVWWMGLTISRMLSKSSIKNIPQNEIEVRDSFYKFVDKQKYAFLNQDKYLFSSYTMVPGVWSGNGYAVITQLYDAQCTKMEDHCYFACFICVFLL